MWLFCALFQSRGWSLNHPRLCIISLIDNNIDSIGKIQSTLSWTLGKFEESKKVTGRNFTSENKICGFQGNICPFLTAKLRCRGLRNGLFVVVVVLVVLVLVLGKIIEFHKKSGYSMLVHEFRGNYCSVSTKKWNSMLFHEIHGIHSVVTKLLNFLIRVYCAPTVKTLVRSKFWLCSRSRSAGEFALALTLNSFETLRSRSKRLSAAQFCAHFKIPKSFQNNNISPADKL